jgi:transcriptional regulator with XRE-family HTH domain
MRDTPYTRGLPTEMELWRRRKGGTIRWLATETRYSVGHLSEVERGRRRPSAELKTRVSKALGVPAEVLWPHSRESLP